MCYWKARFIQRSTSHSEKSTTRNDRPSSYSREPKHVRNFYSNAPPAVATDRAAHAVDYSKNRFRKTNYIVNSEHQGRRASEIHRRHSANMGYSDAVVEDAARYAIGDDELDEEELGDQVMRIHAPAAPLKDVSRVRRDTYHNRSDLARSGLVRAISGAVGVDRIRVAKQQEEVILAYSPSQTNTGREVNVPMHLMRDAIADRSRSPSQGGIRPTTGGLMRSISYMSANKSNGNTGLMRSISSLGLVKSKSKMNSRTSKKSKSSSSNSSHSPSSSPRTSSSKENGLQRIKHIDSPMRRSSQFSQTRNDTNIGDRPRFDANNQSPGVTPGGNGRGQRRLSRMGRSAGPFQRSPRDASDSQLPSNIRGEKELLTEVVGHSPVRTPQRRLSLLKRNGRSMRNLSTSPQSATNGTPTTNVVRDNARDFSDISPVSVASTPARNPSAFSGTERKAARNSLRASVRAIGFSRMLLKKTVEVKEDSSDGPVAGSSVVANGGGDGGSTPVTPEKRKIVLEPLTPEKLDGRGNNFFFSAVRSEKIRACGLLRDDSSRIRVPVLTLAEYSGPVSKSRWFVDAFTLPHNAVRRECMDMYDLVIGMARLCGPDDVMSDDICSFYDWWEVASGFIRCYFEVERKVLIPWVDTVSSKSESQVRMAMRKMRGMKESLKVQLSRIDDAWTFRDDQPAEATYAQVYNAVDAFIPRLMNYFADQEILLPTIVKEHYTIEDRMKMDKELISEFMKTDDSSSDAKHNMVLLVRWMTNPRQSRAFINKYLSNSSRNAYPKWLEMFEQEHHRFVESIKARTGSMND